MNPGPTELEPGAGVFAETLGAARASERLAGRRVLVVGAGQRLTVDADPPIGNGRAIAVLCAREGAVACLDIVAEAAEDARRQIAGEGGKAVALVADVADPAAIERSLDESVVALEGLDGIVLNVGTSFGKQLADQTPESWDREFSINLRSHMLYAQKALRVMPPGSSIVLVSSIAALSATARNPAYESSKAAQLALARSIARAGEPKAIRCNAIAPGLIDTPLGRDAGRHRAGRSALVPFGRQGTAWEVAYATLFLLSHEASYVNGTCLVVDGGLSIGIARA